MDSRDNKTKPCSTCQVAIQENLASLEARANRKLRRMGPEFDPDEEDLMEFPDDEFLVDDEDEELVDLAELDSIRAELSVFFVEDSE